MEISPHSMRILGSSREMRRAKYTVWKQEENSGPKVWNQRGGWLHNIENFVNALEVSTVKWLQW